MHLWLVAFWLGVALVLAAGLWGLRRLVLRMQLRKGIRRGRRKKKIYEAAGAAFGVLDQIYRPQARHPIEQRQKDERGVTDPWNASLKLDKDDRGRDSNNE